MKHFLRGAKQQKASSNVTKCCACHEEELSWSILLKRETLFTMREAAQDTLQLHQILHLPRKNECHDRSCWHLKCHLQCAVQQASPSHLTKYCPCHAKWLSWFIVLTYETSFTMRGRTGLTLPPHQILRLPRKLNVMMDRAHIWNVIYNARCNRHHPPTSPNTAPATQNCISKSKRNLTKTVEVSFPMCDRPEHDPRPIRAWSEDDPTKKRKPQPASPPRVLFALSRSRFYWKLQHFPLRLSFQMSPKCCACHEKWHMNFTKCCTCHETVTHEFHQMLHLPRKVTHELHQMLHLPREVTHELHQMLHLPQEVQQVRQRRQRQLQQQQLQLLLLLHEQVTTTDYYTTTLLHCCTTATTTLVTLLTLLHYYTTTLLHFCTTTLLHYYDYYDYYYYYYYYYCCYYYCYYDY